MEDYNLKLRDARKKLGLTIEQVSQKTKIRPHILATLEEGNFTFLPPVYIISFIKTYSQFLKIPDEEIEYAVESLRKLTKYEKPQPVNYVRTKTSELERQPFSFKKLKKIKLPNITQTHLATYLLYTAAGLAVLCLLYFFFFMNDSNNQTNFQGELGTVKPDTALIKGNEKISQNQELADSIIFEVRGLDTSWLRVNIDGKDSQQFLVVPKFEKEWVAKKFILLTIGNAGAIEFKRDGKVLPPFGSKGNVIRNVKITKDQVISSANPYSIIKDSTVKMPPKKPVVKKQVKKEEPPRLIEPSQFQSTKKPLDRPKEFKPLPR